MQNEWKGFVQVSDDVMLQKADTLKSIKNN